MKVLIIEDNEDIVQIYKHEFEYNKFEVDFVVTGEEGMEIVKQNNYDGIILDYMLPGADGIEVLHHIREDSINKETPVFILTQLDVPVAMEKAYKLGISGYFTKAQIFPFQVIDEVKRVLGIQN